MPSGTAHMFLHPPELCLVVCSRNKGALTLARAPLLTDLLLPAQYCAEHITSIASFPVPC
jgi:hypothetical protein